MTLIERVLVVGLGSIGKRHLRIIRELLPDADIRVLHHRRCTDVPKYSNGCVRDIRAACDFQPHIAVIASPATQHLESAVRLAGIGCHLLIEKPLSDSVDGIDELIAERDRHKVKIQVAYNLRFHSALEFFRNQIQRDRVGKILSVRCEIGQFLPTWRPGTDYRKGVSANRSLGGGVLLELSHELDYLRWIFGDVKSLSANLKKHSKLEIDVEDSAYLTMTFSSKESNEGPTASLCMDFIRHDTTRTCTAIGENGTLKWNALTGVVELWEENADGWEELFIHQHQRDDTYRLEWISFLESVNEQKETQILIEDGLEVIRLIEAARTSAQNNGEIVILTEGK